MDPVERLASDLQALKVRFDEMSLRFAVSEEREKRVDDKLDNMAKLLTLELEGVKKSVQSWNATGRWVLITVGGVVLVAVARFIIGGGLGGL